jgi:mono/diheme cytochrome c family protein
MDASSRSARTAQRRLWTAGIAVCLLAAAACSENRAGGKVQSNTAGGGQPESGRAPHATGDTARGAAAAAAPSSSTVTTVDSTAGRTDSSRAREVGRAPRGNPPAPSPSSSTKAKPDTQPTATPTAPLRDAYHQPPKDTVSQQVYTGWKQFNLNCARCHGEDVTGTTIAPHLIDSFRSGKVDHTEFWNVVHGSRVQKGMPNWSGIIPDDQLEAIYQYVKGRSDGKIGPGRPALKGS